MEKIADTNYVDPRGTESLSRGTNPWKASQKEWQHHLSMSSQPLASGDAADAFSSFDVHFVLSSFTWQHQGKIWTNYELTYEKRKTWVRQASHVEGIKGLEVINPFRDRVKVWGSTQSASGLVTCQPNRPQEVWSSGGTLKERRP